MPRQDAPRVEQRPAAPPVEPLVPPRNLTPPPASPPPPPRPSEPVEPLFTANDLDRPQPPRPEAKPALASLSFSFGGLDQPAASSPPFPPDPRPQSEPEPPLQSPPPPPLHHLRREPEQPAPARTAPDFEPGEAEPPAVELSDEFAADLEASLRESLFGEGTRQDTPAQPVQVAPEPAERAPEPAPPPFFARREAAAPSDYHRDNPFEPSERPHAGSSTAAHEPAFDYHGTEPDYHGTGSDYHGAEPGSYVEPSHPGFESAPAPQSPHGLNLGTGLEQEMASALNEDVYAHGAQRQGAYHDYARNDYAPEGLEQVPHFEQEEKRGGIPVFGIVAGVVIVAIFGGAGAVSYRAIFGETASGPPPVISAGGEPVKVRPENDQAQSDVEDPLVLRGADGDSVENTRIVSRVESLAALPQPNSGETAKIEDRVPQGGDAVTPLEPRVVRPAPIAPDSGVDGPRRVRTLTVRPDGTIEAPPAPEPQVAAQASAAGTLGAADANAGNPGSAPLPGTGGAPSAAQTAAPSTIPLPPPRPGIAVSPVSSAPQPGATATARASNPADAPLEVRRVAVERFRTDDNTAAPQGGPVNLVPQTPAGTAPPVSRQQAAATAPAPVTTQSVASARTAAVAAVQPAAAPQGGYVVQLASRRTQEQALATFSDFQSRFTGQLGNRQPLIQRADLGTRGIFFRVQVGPMAERGEADRLCSDLKSAGLPDCFVQRN